MGSRKGPDLAGCPVRVLPLLSVQGLWVSQRVGITAGQRGLAEHSQGDTALLAEEEAREPAEVAATLLLWALPPPHRVNLGRFPPHSGLSVMIHTVVTSSPAQVALGYWSWLGSVKIVKG